MGEQLMLDFGEDGHRLVPVVVQDRTTGEVLILAFVNRQAFAATRQSGYATFWSRSRDELWQKGLTSGDLLRIDEIRINCEQNSLLYRVTPEGRGACHVHKHDGAPYRSCYYRRVESDDSLRVVGE
ncbi:MAG: phosphoribosyl-AMP cyclohydrolase [Planctomycetota bacterium]